MCGGYYKHDKAQPTVVRQQLDWLQGCNGQGKCVIVEAAVHGWRQQAQQGMWLGGGRQEEQWACGPAQLVCAATQSVRAFVRVGEWVT
jgi:hypothetical protein